MELYNVSGLGLPTLNLRGWSQLRFSWLCLNGWKNPGSRSTDFTSPVSQEEAQASLLQRVRGISAGKRAVWCTNKVYYCLALLLNTDPTKQQQIFLLKCVTYGSRRGDKLLDHWNISSQAPHLQNSPHFLRCLWASLWEEFSGQINGGRCKSKENNTCPCIWPTDFTLMCCLLGTWGISCYPKASVSTGVGRKEFCDQKMWGLVLCQEQ